MSDDNKIVDFPKKNQQSSANNLPLTTEEIITFLKVIHSFRTTTANRCVNIYADEDSLTLTVESLPNETEFGTKQEPASAHITQTQEYVMWFCDNHFLTAVNIIEVLQKIKNGK